MPSFEVARPDVEKDWKDETRKQGLEKAMQALRAKWTVERE